MKDKLDTILDELLWGCCMLCEKEDKTPKEPLDKAKQSILSLIRSCVPKKITTIWNEKGYLTEDYRNGFNSACDLIDKNIDDCMKGIGL